MRVDQREREVRVVASGLARCEGPVVRQSGGVVVGSMALGSVYRVGDGDPSALAFTAGGPNGLAEGADGTLYAANMGSRGHAHRDPRTTGGVQAITSEGEVGWLTQDPVSPNDLCFGPDGLLYVTDPTRQQPWVDGRLWRCDPESGETELLVSLDWYPNGIGFGLEDDAIYVADTSGARIVRFPLRPDGRLGIPELFADIPHGIPDGFAFDETGTLYVGVVRMDGEPSELQVFAADGELLDRWRAHPSSLLTNIALTAHGTAYVTDTEHGDVLEITGWAGSALALHPFRGREAPTTASRDR